MHFRLNDVFNRQWVDWDVTLLLSLGSPSFGCDEKDNETQLRSWEKGCPDGWLMPALTMQRATSKLMHQPVCHTCPRASRNGEERKLFLAVPFRGFPFFFHFWFPKTQAYKSPHSLTGWLGRPCCILEAWQAHCHSSCNLQKARVLPGEELEPLSLSVASWEVRLYSVWLFLS